MSFLYVWYRSTIVLSTLQRMKKCQYYNICEKRKEQAFHFKKLEVIWMTTKKDTKSQSSAIFDFSSLSSTKKFASSGLASIYLWLQYVKYIPWYCRLFLTVFVPIHSIKNTNNRQHNPSKQRHVSGIKLVSISNSASPIFFVLFSLWWFSRGQDSIIIKLGSGLDSRVTI